MNKIQTIICLLVFLIILLSMDIIFGNSIIETFSNNKMLSGMEDDKLRNDVMNEIKRDDEFIGDDQPLHYAFSGKR